MLTKENEKEKKSYLTTRFLVNSLKRGLQMLYINIKTLKKRN